MQSHFLSITFLNHKINLAFPPVIFIAIYWICYHLGFNLFWTWLTKTVLSILHVLSAQSCVSIDISLVNVLPSAVQDCHLVHCYARWVAQSLLWSPKLILCCFQGTKQKLSVNASRSLAFHFFYASVKFSSPFVVWSCSVSEVTQLYQQNSPTSSTSCVYPIEKNNK